MSMASTAAKQMSNSGILGVKSLELFSYPNSSQKSFFMARVLFRILAIAFAVASISLMVTSDQNVFVLGIYAHARYKYSSAFKFLVAAEAVVCGFSVISLICVCVLCRLENHQIKNYFYIFLHDMVMMVLLATGCAAATAIGYVGRYGEEKIHWNAICDFVGKFCNQVLVSIILSYLSFFCYFALNIVSAFQFIYLSNHH